VHFKIKGNTRSGVHFTRCITCFPVSGKPTTKWLWDKMVMGKAQSTMQIRGKVHGYKHIWWKQMKTLIGYGNLFTYSNLYEHKYVLDVKHCINYTYTWQQLWSVDNIIKIQTKFNFTRAFWFHLLNLTRLNKYELKIIIRH